MAELRRESIERAVSGDAEALRTVVDALTPVIQHSAACALLRWAPRRLGRNVCQEVEDMVQEVFVALFRDRGRVLREWVPERGSLGHFVSLIAKREVVSILRSRKQSPLTEEPTELRTLDENPHLGMGPELEATSRELLGAIVAILRERQSALGFMMFQLLFVDDHSVDDVCAIMKMSPDAVYAWRSRLSRVVREIAAEVVSEKGC